MLFRSLTIALEKHGILVPQDVMVSGVDNSPESCDVLPQLTSIAVDYEAMAKEAVYLVRDLLEGVPREHNIYVPAKILFRESTKDCTDREDKRSDEIYQKLIEIREKHNRQSYFSMDMDGCTDYAEMKQIVAKNLYLLGTCKEFYLGLHGEEKDHIRHFKQDITSYAKLGMAIRDDQILNVSGERFRQKDLLPEEVCDDSWKVYYIRVLHNREKNFGYAVVQFENPLDGPDEFYQIGRAHV